VCVLRTDVTRGDNVGTIVVGVDGSESSKRALEFALREAQLRGARLQLVRASSRWSELVTGADDALPWPAGLGETFEEIRSEQEPELTHWLAAARRRTHVHDVAADVKTRTGDAPDVLRAAAGGAELLVVGERRRRDPTRLLLGSVSHEVIRDAPCPVVVVPDEAGREGGPR
jgi:nucleotide-binding universal stress UspA family protein